MYVEITLRPFCTPAHFRPPSQAPEGPMDIDSHLTVTTTRSLSPLLSATIPPPGLLSADHVQWIMASITQLKGKINNLKDEVKHQVSKIMAQQCLQLLMPVLLNFPQQLAQLPPPPAFSQPFYPVWTIAWMTGTYKTRRLGQVMVQVVKVRVRVVKGWVVTFTDGKNIITCIDQTFYIAFILSFPQQR